MAEDPTVLIKTALIEAMVKRPHASLITGWESSKR